MPFHTLYVLATFVTPLSRPPRCASSTEVPTKFLLFLQWRAKIVANRVVGERARQRQTRVRPRDKRIVRPG